MHSLNCWREILAALAWSLCVAALGQAQQPPSRPTLSDTQQCVACHFPGVNDVIHGEFTTDAPFCLREEGAIWQQQDKHRQSLYLLLKAENLPLTNQILRTFKIEEVLQWDLAKGRVKAIDSNTQVEFESVANVRFRQGAAAAQVATVRQCLACHAPLERSTTAGGVATVSVESGVSCQVCHGAGSRYFAAHQSKVWRVVPAPIKYERFGLADLRNPLTRAALCNSCHIGQLAAAEPGSPAVDRLVKHEWYASGHPPLPGFEFATFSTQMPLHWRPLVEKLNAGKVFDHWESAPSDADIDTFLSDVVPRSVVLAKADLAASYREANRQSIAPNPQLDAARTKDVLLSGLAALATYAELLARHPEDAAPELALYDCGACHHELRSQLPSEVRVRRNLVAGRPPPAFWTLALARLGAEAAGGNGAAEFEASVKRVDAQFSARPFGDWSKINVDAARLKAVCERAAEEIVAAPLDAQQAELVLAKLANPANDVDRDYHAARQHAWAIREVVKDLCGVPHRNYILAAAEAPQPSGSVVPPRLVELLGGVRGSRIPSEHEKVRERIDALFDGEPVVQTGQVNWRGPLRLRLPAGQDQQVRENLAAWLEAIANYDPAWFESKLAPIKAAYPLPSR